jgi:hypothetical protein
MAFTLDKIVPWGRSFDEYRRMFSLGEDDLSLKIIGCADGPASFNAESARKGHRVVSVDPLYSFSAEQIRVQIEKTYDQTIEETRRNESEFLWESIQSVEELGRIRWQAMTRFLEDFERGKSEGRYVNGALPLLPFPDRAFELALCSHYLFLYTDHLTESFHIQAITEMCRVAPEVRIFPLLALGSHPSAYVEPVSAKLEALGLSVSIEPVSYEFQRGGDKMMRIRGSSAE